MTRPLVNTENLPRNFSLRRVFGPAAACIVSFGFLFPACQSAPGGETKQEQEPFVRYRLEKTVPFEGDKNGRSLRCVLSLLDPADQGPWGGLRPLVRDTLYEGMGPEQYANRIASSLEEQYGKAKALAAEGPGTAGESFNWEYTETLSLENSIGGLLSISRDRDYYLGGAHGMRERQFFNIYPTEGKKIGLRDLIQPERMAEFRGLAEKALGSRKKIPRGTGLRAGGFFEDTVEIPENFCPSPEGLILHWDPYEIAPYSMGPVEICIPWTELDPLLSDRGRFLVKR